MFCTTSQLNFTPPGLFTVNTFAWINPRGLWDTWLDSSECRNWVCCTCFCSTFCNVLTGNTENLPSRGRKKKRKKKLSAKWSYGELHITALIPSHIWPSTPLWLNQSLNEHVGYQQRIGILSLIMWGSRGRVWWKANEAALLERLVLREAWAFKHNYIQLEALYLLHSWKDQTTVTYFNHFLNTLKRPLNTYFMLYIKMSGYVYNRCFSSHNRTYCNCSSQYCRVNIKYDL